MSSLEIVLMVAGWALAVSLGVMLSVALSALRRAESELEEWRDVARPIPPPPNTYWTCPKCHQTWNVGYPATVGPDKREHHCWECEPEFAREAAEHARQLGQTEWSEEIMDRYVTKRDSSDGLAR